MNQIFALKELIERGEYVALLADRPAPYGSPRLTELPFLGGKAAFPQNPWILASLLECPVYLVTGLRTRLRHYRVRVRKLADRVELPRRTRATAITGYMQVYADHLAEICREFPYQWFNFYDFWRPEDEE